MTPSMPRMIRSQKAVTVVRSCVRLRKGAPAACGRICRTGWNATVRGAAILLTLCLVGHNAWAEGGEEPRWIPSIHIGFDTFSYDTRASVENNIDPPRHEGTQTDKSRQNMFLLGGELMGPMFEGLPGRPRLFIQGGAGLQSFSSDKIFKLGEIATPEDPIEAFYRQLENAINPRPPPPPAPPRVGCLEEPDEAPFCPTAEPEEFDGQGSDIHAKIPNPTWYAALGVSFNLPVANNLLLQVKPSFAYSGEKVDMTGRITTVLEPLDDDVFEVHRTTAEETVLDHHLGAGIELDLALLRDVRPITTSIYVDLRFLWLISDPTTTFADPAGLGVYTVTRDDFSVRGGGGVRFSWKGFGGR